MSRIYVANWWLLVIGFGFVLCSYYSDCIQGGRTWCGCGYQREALGPCVGGECPEGYMCVCDYCCEGCRDDCYDCALFQQYCNNTNYCELRQKCKKTCEVCQDATDDTGDGDGDGDGNGDGDTEP